MDNVLPIDHPRAEASEWPVVIINVENGRIAEIPCGPFDAQYVSGDRIVVWSRELGRAVIPRRHEKRWRFYEEFCTDPEIAKKHGLKPQEAKRYFTAYVEFMRRRGVGSQAKHLHGVTKEQIEKLWHPEVLQLRAASKESRGQRRIDAGMLEQITAGLGGPKQ